MIFINNTLSEANIDTALYAFGVKKDDVEKTYSIEFCSYSKTSWGELEETIVLLKHKKNGLWYFVSGSECSVWDFKEQWEPEPYTQETLTSLSTNKARKDLLDFIKNQPEQTFEDLNLEGKMALYGYLFSQFEMKKLEKNASFLTDFLQIKNTEIQINSGYVDFTIAFGSCLNSHPAEITFHYEGDGFHVLIVSQDGHNHLAIIDSDIYKDDVNNQDFFYLVKDKYLLWPKRRI